MQDILGNAEIIEPRGGLEEKLKKAEETGVPLRVKLGFDPTAPDLHLGHAVVLKKLKQFQDSGHTVVVVIGDYTARIGDPTGRNSSRPPLTEDEVADNARTYLEQLGLVLDLDKVEIVYNSSWFGEKGFADALSLTAQFTLAQIMQRKDFRNRYEEGRPIHIHELMYPMMQGQDSVEIAADVEIGGTDQVFNCMFGRDLQRMYGMDRQAVICMPILPGTDGVEKMSKSKNNYIALTEKPDDMYGKVMSIPDELMPVYIKLLSEFNEEARAGYLAGLEDGSGDPRQTKKALARDIVTQFHNDEDALRAEQFYERMAQGDASALPQIGAGVAENEALSVVELCVKVKEAAGLQMSNGQIRRLIQQGGVSLDNEKFTDPNQMIYARADMVVKIGKKNIFRLETDDAAPAGSAPAP